MRTHPWHLILPLILFVTASSAQFVPHTYNMPVLRQPALDQMLAPIALYPDALLSQVLIASAYPLEVAEADRWLNANPALKSATATQAVDSRNWDPSVRYLLAFPQVLRRMRQKLEWTQRLGDGYRAQPSQVLDTIQALRQRARRTGNLTSNTQISVTQSGSRIGIMLANPDEIDVPSYDPAVVYGFWPWPEYPPEQWMP